jgi:ABC-type transport system involved in cytochrome c biogenesis permease subunit
MNEKGSWLPWVILGGSALYLIYLMFPPRTEPAQMQLEELGALPVQEGGRIKPFDSMARTTLMLISGKQEYKDENGQTQPAIKWVMDVFTQKESAEKAKVFRIDNLDVLSLLGLPPRSQTNFRYAYEEFKDKNKINLLREKAIAARKVPEKERDAFQVKVLEVWGHFELFRAIAQGVYPRTLPPLFADQQDWRSMAEAYEVIPADVRKELRKVARYDPDLALGLAISTSYEKNDAKPFNELVAAYRKDVEKRYPAETSRTSVEMAFNHFEPFYQCAILYALVFLLSCFAWFGWADALNRSAFWLMVLTLVVHTGALFTRMYLMNRWFVFVTNLYSSAVFIGWGCVAVCLALEWLYRNGIGNLVGSVLGALTMLVAHHLAAGGDTMEMLRAVLDTNFWLATHVTCVTYGYTATFVAGFLGLVYILRGVLTPSLDKETGRALSQMLYGVVCFATLLSFTGTVLGGIWADQSWGRFWGWDPKENGALLIVIWNALILHARWGGLVKQRGMAVLAVAGNMVTGWSWFGTNQLGVGLHAYGFNNTLATGLVIFWGSQIAVIVVGMLPLTYWKSYAALTATVSPVDPPSIPQSDKPAVKGRGKRGGKRGDPSYFPGHA